MSATACQITSLTIVYSTVYSGADEKPTLQLHVAGLYAGNIPATGEFPAQRASNAENVSMWWRHHDFLERELFAEILSEGCKWHQVTIGSGTYILAPPNRGQPITWTNYDCSITHISMT